MEKNNIELKECGSTQDIAKNNIKEMTDLSYVLSRCQTGGKGRFDRTWVSSLDKGLYVSIVVQPRLAKEYWPLHSFMAGMAVMGVLENYGLKPKLKWPNDVLIDGKKICGILCEQAEGKIIVGIGLNFSLPIEKKKNIAKPSCAMDEYVSPLPGKKNILNQIIENLEKIKNNLNTPKETVEFFKIKGYKIGKPVVFRHYQEEEEVTIIGINENGFLKVKNNDDEIQIITSGEIKYEF